MNKKLEPIDIQNKMIDAVYGTFSKCIEPSKRSFSIKNNETDIRHKLFVTCYICNSCSGNIENLYKSFKNLLSVDYIAQEHQKYEKYVEELTELEQQEDKYIKEKDNYQDEFNDKKNYIKNVEEYLSYTDTEYIEINTDPQFKEIYQIEAKTKKRTDKSERTNQLIIHDMIYLIDHLNRQICMGKGNKK